MQELLQLYDSSTSIYHDFFLEISLPPPEILVSDLPAEMNLNTRLAIKVAFFCTSLILGVIDWIC